MRQKIGLIGNMNNNNFAMLRYLIDMGFDAKLILMKNDGKDKSSHFSIESDTWDEEKWSKYIEHSNIYEHPISALNFPYSWALFLFTAVKSFFSKVDWVFPISKKNIHNVTSEFDILIGSGISPAMLFRIGAKLTIFCPYSMGVEYLESPLFKVHLETNNLIRRFFANKVYQVQLSGIKMSEHVLVSDVGLTKNALTKHQIKFENLCLPILYDAETRSDKNNSKILNDLIKDIKIKDFVLLSHVRHLWVKPENLSDEKWEKQNKHNDWILLGFASFLEKHKINAVLILFEYGDDVSSSKDLCTNLGIEKNILWLARSQRKEILDIIDYVDVGVGEFYSGFEALWGGTLVEFASRGKPTIHGLNIGKENFEADFNIDIPPILISNSASEIADKICYLYENKEDAINIGKLSKIWFDENYGRQLVKKWANFFI